jgi:threonine aldolase
MDGVSIDLDAVETNIVVFQVTGKRSAAEVAARVKARGVLISALERNLIRLVTHLDVDRAACEIAAGVLAEAIGAA